MYTVGILCISRTQLLLASLRTEDSVQCQSHIYQQNPPTHARTIILSLASSNQIA